MRNRWSQVVYLTGFLSVLASCAAEEEPSASGTAVQQQHAFGFGVRVVFLGNSITAGYGLDPEEAFPALIQARADSLGWPVQLVNAGLSGETTAGGLSRLPWLLEEPVDILIIELGANDGLRGINPEVTARNLRALVRLARRYRADTDIILAGMQVPPNLGTSYATAFAELFPAVQQETGTHLIPFILEGVAGEASLNLADGIHPNAAGHRRIADLVWETLAPLLAARVSALPK